MKNYKKKRESFGSRIFTIFLVLVISAVMVGGISYFISGKQPNEPSGGRQGMYLSDVDSDRVVIERGQALTLKLENGDGWGEYSVQDCTVTIIPNVAEEHDFEFVEMGSLQTYKFSEITDLTEAFTENYDGKSISISESGEFTLTYSSSNPLDILQKVRGKKIVLVEGYELSADYPYVALEIVSPDGAERLCLPIVLDYVAVSGIELDKSEVIF